ncbi:hypothetical protein [Bradyrhizobium liaoningense]
MTGIVLPTDLESVREAARRALAPIRPTDASSRAALNFLFTAERADASRNLPPHYLIYFLFVDLLGFRNLGRFEKLDWSVPLDFEGQAYLIEHRKSGVGIFVHDAAGEKQQVERVVALIGKSVKAAAPFFKWMADNAVRESKFNVRNVGGRLFARYTYFRDNFRTASTEAANNKQDYEASQKQRELPVGGYSVKERSSTTTSELVAMFTFPWVHMEQRSGWLALAAIDAFFAWTEHIFIHLAILQGRITTGEEVASLADSEWKEKFKSALDITDNVAKKHLDTLVTIKRQLRNFMAHGAFGKEGQAFSFHSNAGAVPVALDHRTTKSRFSLTPELAFDDTEALAAIESFIAYLWSGQREPARLYIQETDLPLILPMASDGTYAAAMTTVDDMNAFVDRLMRKSDAATNMDWWLVD